MTTNTFDFLALSNGFNINYELRAEIIDGAPWFLAPDVFEMLGLCDRSERRLLNLIEGEQRIDPLLGSGPCRTVACCLISKRGLFKLIMKSRQPGARPLQDWVVREVFPSIRETGEFTMAIEPCVHGGLPVTWMDFV